MTSNNPPAPFVFKFSDDLKLSYNSSFPSLTLPNLQNPLEEVGLHKQMSKTLDDLKCSEFSENSNTSQNIESLKEKIMAEQDITPKSQKQKPSEVKRWASVVKAQKKLQLSTELEFDDKYQSECTEITLDVFDYIFKTLPKSFESHKSFFVIINKMFHCNICSLNLDSVLSLSNHLKTRKHEDNAIEFFKSKMPSHLHYIMEFVSFYGSNLCCNLCRCKISMSSNSPYETIVNIIAHNNDESHINKKVNHETRNSAETILQALSQSSSIILENMQIIEKKMIPEFQCQLCKTVILYNDSREVLSQNFFIHFKSMGHMKNQKAVEVLKSFGETNIGGKDSWVVNNGNIMCTYCNREFETNLQDLISHVNEVEHATNVYRKCVLGISSSLKCDLENDTVHENLMNEVKSFALNKPKKVECEKKSSLEFVSTALSKPGSRLKELLNTMPTNLRDVDYVIENEKGSVTCLICNRVVPPSTYNLRTHLLGNKHKTNMELRNQIPVGDSRKKVPDTSKEVVHNETTAQYINPNSNISKHIGFVLKKTKDSFSCLICQFTSPKQQLFEHLTSDEHKKRESLWMKNCPCCMFRNPFTSRVLHAIPASIRLYKCRKMETIPASVLNHLYALLVKDNALIRKNENVLIKNVDGKHSYCNLCKTLIPLSLDVDILETNVISHLVGKRHKCFSTVKIESTKDASTSPELARSLFELPEPLKESNVFKFEDFARLICKDTYIKTEDQTKPFTFNLSSSLTEKKLNDEVFVFGKEGSSGASTEKCENAKVTRNSGQCGALPVAEVTRLVKFEEETDEDVLNRRQKQIDYGKNTDGYIRYNQLIPRRKRGIHHPITPPRHLRCSRRTWDGMIRAWRRQLHSWDPPSSSLDSDIRPLE